MVSGACRRCQLVRYNVKNSTQGETTLLMKIFIVLFLLTILYSLLSSFFFLVRDKGKGDRTVKRLTWRIGLSLVLFVFLWGAYQLGWIEPSSRGPVHPPGVDQADDQP
jgi:O-antigen/teichoic acid export membrane protein